MPGDEPRAAGQWLRAYAEARRRATTPPPIALPKVIKAGPARPAHPAGRKRQGQITKRAKPPQKRSSKGARKG